MTTKKFFPIFVLIAIILIGIAGFYNSIFGSATGDVFSPKPFLDNEERVLIKRNTGGYPVGCPAGWSDGGTGIASYGPTVVTYERYCY